MATVSHEPSRFTSATPGWTLQLRVPEMWAGLAIISMWIAVLFTAVFGPSMVFTDAGGSTTIPSVLPVAGAAFLATWALGATAFRRERKPN
jgi:uncharacterized membrane protein YgdD (TMEM256/DUF423 family)